MSIYLSFSDHRDELLLIFCIFGSLFISMVLWQVKNAIVLSVHIPLCPIFSFISTLK